MRSCSRLILVVLLISSACNTSPKQQEAVPQNAIENKAHSRATASEIDEAQSKAPNTTYFRASGTEPFWSLEISEYLVVFKTPTDSIKLPHVQPIMAQDSNVKRYAIETESTTMTIQIAQGDCINDMSGKVSPYSVTIRSKRGVDEAVQRFEGCGHYVTDYRLHDIWVLESLAGKTISKADFSKEFPRMEIKAAENTFTGFAGCNRMNGTLFFEKGVLRFTEVATTRMMCAPDHKEAEFLKALQGSTTYAIENNRLTLSNPSGILMVFKKID